MNQLQLSAKQQIIFRELLKINMRAAEAYKGALKVLKDNENPDRFSQAAHSLRELTGLILRDISIPHESVEEEKKAKGKDRQRRKLEKRFVDKPELLPSPSEAETRKLIREWNNIHNDYFISVAHHGRLTDEEEFQKYLARFEALLEVFMKPVPEAMKELDELLCIKSPAPADVDRLIGLIRHPAHSGYFFSKLSNINWFIPLKEKGFFVKAPQGIQEGEYIVFPNWIAAEYLLIISDIIPREVIDVIKNVKETNNFRVYMTFIDCVLKMPASLVKEIIPAAKKWINTPYWNLLPDKIGDLTLKLAKENEIDSAMELLEVLIDVRKTKTKKEELVEKAMPLYRIWEYGKILKKVIPIILEKKPEETIVILLRKILKAIAIDHSRSDETRDISYIWRPAIEKDAEREAKNILVTSLRNSLENIGKANKDKFTKCYERMKNYKLPIFRRIEIHLMRLFPEWLKEEIERNFRTPNILGDINLWHENYHLLREQYSILSIEDKNKIISWIDIGPDLDEFKRWYKQERGIDPTEEEVSARKAHWQIRYLAAIENSLPAERKREYDELVAKYGRPEHPDYHHYIEVGWRGNESPLKNEEIDKMTTAEILEYIKNWKPNKDFFGASREGLAGLLKERIIKNPNEFIIITPLFKDLHPIFAYTLFDAFRELIKENALIQWGPILDLVIDISETPIANEIPRDNDRIYDWKEAKRAAADLLRYALENETAAPPFDYRNRVFKIVALLLKDEEPDLEYEKKYGGDKLDAFTLSINTIRGKAFHTLIQYALWCSRNLSLEKEENKLVPEVVDLMVKLLNPDYEPTQTLRAAFGESIRILFYLNKKWVIDKIEMIFPEDTMQRNRWRAAWEAYIKYNDLCSDIYFALKKQYATAINKYDSSKISDMAKEKLSEHLMAAYMWGIESLEEKSLIRLLFEKAEPKYRGHAIWFIGRQLEFAEEWKAERKAIISRIEILLKWRIGESKNASGETAAKAIEEISKYGICFVNDHLNEEWSINTLVEILQITGGKIELETQVIDEVEKYINNYPRLGLKAINLIVNGDKEGWVVAASKAKITEILEKVKRHTYFVDIKDDNNDLIGSLTKKGYFDFKKYYIH